MLQLVISISILMVEALYLGPSSGQDQFQDVSSLSLILSLHTLTV